MPNNPGANNYQNLRDQNRVTVASGQSNADSTQSLPFLCDHVTGRLLVDSTGGGSSSGAVIIATDSGDHQNYTLSEAATTTQFFVMLNNGVYASNDSVFPFSLTSVNTVLTFNSPLPSSLSGTQIYLICV